MHQDLPDWEAILGTQITDMSPLNNDVTHLTIGRGSHIFRCSPWENIYIWANIVCDKHLPYGESPGYRYATINYCLTGRCEVCLPDDTYIYMEPGMLCFDCHEPKDGYSYPTGEYTGLELALDLDALRDNPSPALRAYGDFSQWIEKLLASGNGSHIASVNEDCRNLIISLFQSLKQPEVKIDEHRFNTLTLLYRLKHGDMSTIPDTFYVTKGQRMIVSDVEARIAEDLSQHLTVTELAKDYGISPSSLKTYFEKVYGLPISHYVRELRINRAKCLLSETKNKVSEIAESCGYSHQGKFGDVFKDRTGMSPLEYRRRNYNAKGEVNK